MSDRQPKLQEISQYLLKLSADWFVIGVALEIPLSNLHEIEASYPQGGVKRWMIEMIQYWLDTTPTACWEQVVRVLEQMNQLVLASTIKQKYLWKTDEETSAATDGVTPASVTVTPISVVTTEIEVDKEIVKQLCDLKFEFYRTLSEFRQKLVNCNISDVRFILNDLFETDDFTDCKDIEDLVSKLCQLGHIDTFNVYLLTKIAECLNRTDADSFIKEYEEKKDRFLHRATVLDFQKAIVSQIKPVLSEGQVKVEMKIPKELAYKKVLKDIEKLVEEAFEENQKWFVHFHAIPGCVILVWHVRETLCETLEQLVHQKAAMFREKGVEEVIIGEKVVFHNTEGKEPTEQDSIEELTSEQEQILAEQFNDKLRQTLVEVLSDRNTHLSIVSKLHSRAVISHEVMEDLISSTDDIERASTLIKTIRSEDKLSELITAAMEEKKMQLLMQVMSASLEKDKLATCAPEHEVTIVEEQDADDENTSTEEKHIDPSATLLHNLPTTTVHVPSCYAFSVL